MASGLDTDTMVKQMMAGEKAKVDKAKQAMQAVQWKKDNYREITNLLRGFKDDFFDVLKPSSNMRSSNNYKSFTAVASDSSYVTATANSDATAGSHSIEVLNLATYATKQSDVGLIGAVEASTSKDISNKQFMMTLDGVTKKIGTGTSLVTFQTAIDTAFGAGKVKVSDLDVDAVNTKLSFMTEGGATKLSISAATENPLTDLGFEIADNLSNRINIGSTLESLSSQLGFAFGVTNKLNLTINGKDFSFDKSITLMSMMSQINSDSTANATMQYDEINDKITLTAKKSGAGSTLDISETGSDFLAKINMTSTAGEDASIKLDGQIIKRSSNTFTSSGITYTVLKETEVGKPQTMSLAQDVDGVYNKIKTFVDKYNEVLAKINLELVEKHDRNYTALTDEQKEAMSEDDIKVWEDKSKTGLLRNDSILNSMAVSMRTAVYDVVKDVSGALSSIGITTGAYTEKGKLIIDETKLKDAIRNTPDQVMNIFSKESSVTYNESLSDGTKRTIRYKENGIVNRLYDIIQDNIRTNRDNDGKKGALLEKAGTSNDITEFDNILQDDIDDRQDRIDEMIGKLYDKEDRLYAKFTAMEKAMQQMNSQSSWISQQFSSGQ